MKLGNLLDHPTFKISDRRAILQRIYDALLNDKDAMLDFKGTARYTPDETANWQSRQVIADLLLAFPASHGQGHGDKTHGSQPSYVAGIT